MSKVRFKGHVLLTLRTVLTVIAWAALIIYVHPLGHEYIDDIREILGSPVSQLAAQVVLLSTLVYLMMLSLPVLPNLRVRGLLFWQHFPGKRLCYLGIGRGAPIGIRDLPRRRQGAGQIPRLGLGAS